MPSPTTRKYAGMQMYKMPVGSFEGFLKVAEIITPFDGSLVMDPETIESDSIEGLLGETEIIKVVVQIPEANAAYFDAIAEKLGLAEEIEKIEVVDILK